MNIVPSRLLCNSDPNSGAFTNDLHRNSSTEKHNHSSISVSEHAAVLLIANSEGAATLFDEMCNNLFWTRSQDDVWKLKDTSEFAHFAVKEAAAADKAGFVFAHSKWMLEY